MHTGRHKLDTIPVHVEDIHADAFDAAAFAGRNFYVVFALYGRLRAKVTLSQEHGFSQFVTAARTGRAGDWPSKDADV